MTNLLLNNNIIYYNYSIPNIKNLMKFQINNLNFKQIQQI